MLSSSRMELVSVAVLKDKAEVLLKRLIDAGIFHPVDIRHIEASLHELSGLQMEKERTDVEALQTMAREINRALEIRVSPEPGSESLTSEEIRRSLDALQRQIEPIISRRDEYLQNLKTKEAMVTHLKEYFPLPFKQNAFYTFLDISLGEISENDFDALARSLIDVPHVIYPLKRSSGYATVVVIGLRRDRAFVERVLRDFSWRKVELPQESGDVSRAATEKLSAEISAVKKDIEAANKELSAIAAANRPALSSVAASLSLKSSLIEAKKYSCATERTVLVCGWVPYEDRARVYAQVKAVDPSSCIEECSPSQVAVPKEEIPVRLVHHAALKPFVLLIDSYGLPRYGTVDPTIFVAISFLIMFGAMFGDLGQGLVLLAVGLLIRKSRKEKVSQSGTLLAYCGISSALFGLLYGSVFGFEELIPALWLKPMHDIFAIFRVSIIFGIAVITAGIVLNIINALRDKDYLKVFFDKAGLLTGIIYWIAIAALSKMFAAQTAIPALYVIILVSCFLLLFLKPCVELLFAHKKESLFVAFMESSVDILEIVMGYLANTVSFIRVAAFALAHVGLFLAIFELSRVLQNVGGGVLSVFTIIIGNILIMLLEGMVVCIQSLRLNYYEFFSKFFITGRNAYAPLTRKIH